MNELEYIPLLVVFFLIFYSIFKENSLKQHKETDKTILHGQKNEKIASLSKTFAKPLNLQTKITKKEIISPDQKVILLEEKEGVGEMFFEKNIEEIKKGILYTEILNFGKEDRSF